MFCILYRFTVRPGMEARFERYWREFTEQFYRHAGSLGSRLHQPEDNVYLAYAQWPDRATWKSAADKLPASADAIRDAMRDACREIEILNELEVSIDLLKQTLAGSDG